MSLMTQVTPECCHVHSPLFAEHSLRRPPPLLGLSLSLRLGPDLDLGRQRLRPGELAWLRGKRGHQGGRGQSGVRLVLWRGWRVVTTTINSIGSRGRLDRLLK